MVSFIFPGQGSQKIGMLSAFENTPSVRAIFDTASAHLNIDFWNLAQNGPAEQQNLTHLTQPLLLIAGYALYQEIGIKPSLMAGHSLGEFTAITCAGSIPFLDAVQLVQKRGQLMQQAVPQGQGAMAALIGATEEAAQNLCAALEQVWCANFNAHGQVVIAGKKEGIQKAATIAKDFGIKRVLDLPVSIPSHCPLMEPAQKAFAEVLNTLDWKMPEVPVIHNATVKVASSVQELKNALAAQLISPVPWTKIITLLGTTVVELGPGEVLSNLIKRTSTTIGTRAINTPEDVRGLHA